MNDLRIVVAGHVDHGKSTIIGRLLYETGSLSQQAAEKFEGEGGSHAAYAFVTDQLSEEQEGSFTLDTAQAYLRTTRRSYTLIDTPGHREFLKNMVTGTTRADAAILVVDALEGPRPQTYLHAYLIAMLGIRQIIVAVNKMDLISYDSRRFHDLARSLGRHLEKIGIPPLAIVPVSAQQGDHVVRQSDKMSWCSSGTLLDMLDGLVHQEANGCQPLRFLVQCPFPANDRKAILGRMTSGRLHRGQAIRFGPEGHATRVTSVLLGQQEISTASAGQSVGLFLEDPSPVRRGDVGFTEDTPPWVTDRFSARVFWISPQLLQAGAEVDLLCGTQSRRARVERIAEVIHPVSLETIDTAAARLEDSQVAEIVFRSDSPMCIDAFGVIPELGRFAVLQGGRIAGGGVIPDQQCAARWSRLS